MIHSARQMGDAHGFVHRKYMKSFTKVLLLAPYFMLKKL